MYLHKLYNHFAYMGRICFSKANICKHQIPTHFFTSRESCKVFFLFFYYIDSLICEASKHDFIKLVKRKAEAPNWYS